MPIPLLRLPEKLTIDVLQTFGIRELLAISILSKRVESIVELLELRPLDANLHIGNSIKFEVCFPEETIPILVLEFYKNTRRRNTVLNIPKKVTVTSDGNQTDEWKFPSSKMTMKGWFQHVSNVLYLGYSVYFEFGFKIFDFESIKKSLKGIEFCDLSIAENIPMNQSRMILKEFLPISYQLILRRNPFRNEEDWRSILIQNFRFFCYEPTLRLTEFTLDDMLMCNSNLLHIYLSTWTTKEMNRFLKLWRKGAFPKLIQLAFLYAPEEWIWDHEKVLKGISFQEFTEDRVIEQFEKNNNGEQFSIRGGYDIHGKDGRICSIEVVEQERVVFYFY